VKINIHEQIYAWREVMEEKRQIPLVKKQAMRVAGQVLSHTVLYRTAASAMESTLKVLPRFALYNQLNAWGQHRENPQPAKETFHDWYRKNRSEAAGKEITR
jgi:L-lactate dehydrogenase complex protein LldF